MSLSLSPTLTAEQASLLRRPAGKLTVEQFLPRWTEQIAGQAGQYAHGHAAAVAPNGAGAGEDVLFRARSNGGLLEIAALSGTNLDDPTGWEALFTSSGLSGLVDPEWSADSGAAYGGSVAAVWRPEGGSVFRVFYFSTAGALRYADFNTAGSLTGQGDIATGLSVDASLQLGACRADELFVLRTEQVEPGYAAWHKPIYGTKVYRYAYSGGSWTVDASFHFHTHAEGNLVKDNPDYDAPDTAVIGQWGSRPCGGLAVNEIDADTVAISYGQTYWKRWGYNTSSQGLQSFLYYRDGGVWRRSSESGVYDFGEDDPRLSFDVMARGSAIEGNQVVVWSRLDEPLQNTQAEGATYIPRLREVVYAKFDSTGRNLTQFQSLGPQADLTAATLLAVNHAGSKTLYALGWQAVYSSPPAAFLCDVPEEARQDLELYAPGYSVKRDNRWQMTVEVPLTNAAIRFEPDTVVAEGNLLRAYHGAILPESGQVELIQVGQGYLDLSDPTIDLAARKHQGKLVGRADKLLLDTRAESFDDVLPQNVRNLPPDNPIKYVARNAGFWELVEAKWPALFFPGQYPNLVDKTVYELGSSMEAFTGGGRPGGGDTPPGVYGGGGKVWQVELHKRGTFYSDVVWLAHDPTIDGAVQATMRAGDNLNYPNFSGVATSGCPVTGTIIRSNGHIQRIDYSTHDCHSAPDGVWNQVAQEATMCGLICEAVQIGKKYAFVLETNSDFDNASHLEDQAGRYWNSLTFDAPDFGSVTRPPDLSGTKGPLRFYLILSDYDEDNPDWQETTQADRAGNPNWQDEQLWLHRYVAGGVAAKGGVAVGKPLEMKMQVLGGTICCFYRAYTEPNKSLWYEAFRYNAGRFGAGKFGLVGRGHSTIYWDALWPLRDHLTKTRNVVDFWDIKMTDGVEDRTIEESLAGYAWQGLTATQFRSLVNEPSLTLSAGQLYTGFNTPPDFSTPLKIENLTIDFDLTISADGGEAGAYLKAVDSADPQKGCVYLGLRANSVYKTDDKLECYAVLRRFKDGAEVAADRDYSPSPLHLKPGQTYPVRITVRDNLYSIWVAGNYVGHFGLLRESEEELRDARIEECHFGLYALGASATFENVRVPELYEIPYFSLLDINQAMKEAMTELIGQRKIKGVFRPDGKLLLSYFSWHDQGPAFENSLKRNQYRQSDRFVSVCHVEGAYTWAEYASPVLLPRGRRFVQIHNPDLMLAEHCYREAQATVREAAEQMEQATFSGPPDLRAEPEDESQVVVDQQNLNDTYLLDSVELSFDLPKRQSETTISTRKKVNV